MEFGGKAPVIFCSRFFLLFPGVSATVSTHFVTLTAVPELNSFHGRGTLEFFGIRSARPLTMTSVLKTKFFIPISSDETGTTSDAKASANHLVPSSSSSSPGRATQWPAFPSSSYQVEVMGCRYLDLQSNWIRYFVQQAGREELTFIHILLLTVNLWGLLRRVGEIDLTSLLSVAYHVTKPHILNYHP